jgi:hypothetical protein
MHAQVSQNGTGERLNWLELFPVLMFWFNFFSGPILSSAVHRQVAQDEDLVPCLQVNCILTVDCIIQHPLCFLQ